MEVMWLGDGYRLLSHHSLLKELSNLVLNFDKGGRLASVRVLLLRGLEELHELLFLQVLDVVLRRLLFLLYLSLLLRLLLKHGLQIELLEGIHII